MMLRGAQLESRQWGGGRLLLLCALLMWGPRGVAQNAPAVPTGATAAPAVPALPAGSVPSVAQSQARP
jgi:hypothetical protein